MTSYKNMANTINKLKTCTLTADMPSVTLAMCSLVFWHDSYGFEMTSTSSWSILLEKHSSVPRTFASFLWGNIL